MSNPILRVHPSIGLARVGNSPEYYLAPETIAALPIPGQSGPRTGGLPIRPGTESETVRSSELRDAEGRFKRQAARFRIYQYPADQADRYPAQGAEEVVIGSVVGGRTVTDIVWTVHVANKKAAWYQSPDDWGIIAYQQRDLDLLTLRNLPEGLDPHNQSRLRRLMIDAGPRTIRGSDQGSVAFERGTEASAASVDQGRVRITELPSYPQTYPRTIHPPDMLLEPQGPIDTLGELSTDAQGRLIVAGGYGRAVAWFTDGTRPHDGELTLYSIPVSDAVNNNQFYDDTSDGPVTAILLFDDGSALEVEGAWVVTTDPGYAPQTLNVVSLWDDVYDTFIRKLDLDPRIWRDGHYVPDYRPSFPDQIQPFFKSAAQQMWNTFLPRFAIAAHDAVGRISADDRPDDTVMANLTFIRDPNDPAQSNVGAPLMPLSLGDANKAFLSPTYTQYFMLQRWAADAYDKQAPADPLGPGEYLDRAVLQNCLGGRFSPGIDMTFIARRPELYVTDWRQSGSGPFRIHRRPLDYTTARSSQPFLGFGWVPADPVAALGVEPGDICKFMALPWHADYNSCAIHQTAPNPLASNTLYWSWPAQRPVTVYVAGDVQTPAEGQAAALPAQRYSIRGPGTMPEENTPTDAYDLANAGRFWNYNDMLVHWQDIGVIIQATNIDDGRESLYDPSWYLEVESLLSDGPPLLADPHPWPFVAGNDTALRRG